MLPGLKRLSFATVAAGSVLAVAACGSSSGSDKASTVVQADNGEASKTGPQVLKDGVAAMLASGAVHGTGVGTEGKPAQAITVDMHLQSDGISIISKSPAGSFALIVIGKTTYTKNSGDDRTANGISSMILKKYANRWVKFTSASDTGFDDTTNLAGFAKSIASLDGGVTIAPKVTRGSLNGEDVVIVTESDGSSFSIAATGTPYVLQAVKVDSSKDGSYGGGKLTFSDYGKRISITAPAGALDVDSLMNQPGVAFPSGFPTDLPSGFPTDFPTDLPSGFPTAYPSGFPTAFPTDFPSS